jgi:hypothetical protein
MSERMTSEQLNWLREQYRTYDTDPWSPPRLVVQTVDELFALRGSHADLIAALVEVGDFLADDCVENYPFDRIPGSFADEADRLLKLIKKVTDPKAEGRS